LAIIWIVFWPNNRVASPRGLRHVFIRWFHSLTWLLLALAALLGAFEDSAVNAFAQPLALASLIAYIVFLGATFTAKRSVQSEA